MLQLEQGTIKGPGAQESGVKATKEQEEGGNHIEALSVSLIVTPHSSSTRLIWFFL